MEAKCSYSVQKGFVTLAIHVPQSSNMLARCTAALALGGSAAAFAPMMSMDASRREIVQVPPSKTFSDSKATRREQAFALLNSFLRRLVLPPPSQPHFCAPSPLKPPISVRVSLEWRRYGNYCAISDPQ